MLMKLKVARLKVRLVINHAKRVWNLPSEVDALDDKIAESERDMESELDKFALDEDIEEDVERVLEDTPVINRLEDRIDTLESELADLRRAVHGNGNRVGA